jgi:hypothetical protein
LVPTHVRPSGARAIDHTIGSSNPSLALIRRVQPFHTRARPSHWLPSHRLPSLSSNAAITPLKAPGLDSGTYSARIPPRTRARPALVPTHRLWSLSSNRVVTGEFFSAGWSVAGRQPLAVRRYRPRLVPAQIRPCAATRRVTAAFAASGGSGRKCVAPGPSMRCTPASVPTHNPSSRSSSDCAGAGLPGRSTSRPALRSNTPSLVPAIMPPSGVCTSANTSSTGYFTGSAAGIARKRPFS